MRIALTILICILVSGCGLLRKTTKKVNSTEHVAKTEESSESKKKSSEVSSESSQKKESETTNEREQRDLDSQTSIQADKITVDKDGNLKAEGNAKLTNNKKDRGKSEKDSNKAIESSNNKAAAKDTSEHSKGNKKGQTKDEDKKQNTISEPSGKEIIYGAIGFLIIVFGIMWYFGVNRKR